MSDKDYERLILEFEIFLLVFKLTRENIFVREFIIGYDASENENEKGSEE